MAFILGKKIKMTQIWKDGKIVPVTEIEAQPNVITLIRKKDKDGYNAIQVSLGKTRRETRVGEKETYEIGKTLEVTVFKEGDTVSISGLSKGRGFQGVVKRHGFSGGPKTRGQKNRHRAPGSIGNTSPQRVIPGRRMAGHMGNARVTVEGLRVVSVDKDKNKILVRGAVPGYRGTLLEVKTV